MQSKHILLGKLKYLSDQWRRENDDANTPQVKMETLIEEYLKDNPDDVEMLIILALTVDTVPLADCEKAVTILKKVLEIDPHNAYALIICAYIETHNMVMSDDIFERLCAIHNDDPEIMSMIEFVKAWGHETYKDYENYEKSLLKSIELCKHHSRNYKSLGYLYIKRGRVYEGKELLKKALLNIKHIYSQNPENKHEIYDINEFLNERIKGIHVTEPNFEFLEERLFGENSTVH